jgi:peptide/nickel transport system substrate-binding protein
MHALATLRAGRLRLGRSFVAAAALALLVLGPASAVRSRYGGTLVVALAADPGSLDPTVGIGGPSRYVINAFCLRLYEYTWNHGSLALEPVLATAPPQRSADKRSYTVQLRQGLEFNDGTPFNAAAVVATYERYISYPGSIWTADFADVGSVTTSGPYTVVFHLTARDAAFSGNMYVLSPTALASEGANFAANPVCAGPFMFDHQVVGDNVSLVKSPYWYKRSAVYLDKIIFKSIPDPAAQVAALEAGDIQMIYAVDPSLVAAVRQDSNLEVTSGPGLASARLTINIADKNGMGKLPYTNVGTPLAQSPKLRQAFEEAIDRNALNRVVFAGLEKPSCTPIPPTDTLWYTATKVPCTAYDPADAKKLVEAMGLPIPITVHLLINSAQTYWPLLAQFLQAEEAAVGFNLVIDQGGSAALGRTTAGQFDVSLGYTTTAGPDPNDLLYPSLDTNGAQNSSGYSNPRVDYVLAHGLESTDSQARGVYYHVAQQIVHDERPLIVLYNSVGFTAFNASLLMGIEQPTVTGTVSFANAQFK